MGESPWRVRAFGSPVADRVRNVPRMTRKELSRNLGIELRAPLGVVTFHPATLTRDLGLAELDALLAALARFPGTLVFTAPNADLGGAAVRARLERFLARRPRGRDALVDSLGQRRYFSLMALADVMAGNSSSGLLEAPHFRLPAVNVGSRQDGRERGHNVIDARPTAAAVSRALARALTPKFRRALPTAPGSHTPVATRITRVLREAPLDGRLLRKEFHELG
jgi:UDP-N-acetylglucosamine 2-epimerase (non-hydrolysing)/GDP/UDP-N,N'-diacetylbacillosamine 2-epimerase (hydrolysing)